MRNFPDEPRPDAKAGEEFIFNPASGGGTVYQLATIGKFPPGAVVTLVSNDSSRYPWFKNRENGFKMPIYWRDLAPAPACNSDSEFLASLGRVFRAGLGAEPTDQMYINWKLDEGVELV